MSEVSHTPGPWIAREDRTVAAQGVPLLRCYANRNDKANAHLIAAAPELLAALKRLSTVYDAIWVRMSDKENALCRDAWDAADAAIAKAEGRDCRKAVVA